MKLEKLSKDDLLDIRHITEVSETTGEVITYTKEVYTEEGSEKLANNRKIKVSQKDLHKYLNEDIGNFFFYFYNRLDEVDISPQYKVRFLILATYLDYESEYISTKDDSGIKIRLSTKDVKEIMKLSKGEFSKTINALISSELIENDDGYYKINIQYAFRGELDKRKSNYTRVFIDTVKALYNKTDSKNHKQLYYIFKLLPTVNKQFNIPCREIDCDIMEMIDPLNMSDICEVLGYHRTNRSKVWKMLRGFKVEDDYMFCKHEVDDIDFLCINPKLFYAGTQIQNLICMINVFDMAKNVNSNSKS